MLAKKGQPRKKISELDGVTLMSDTMLYTYEYAYHCTAYVHDGQCYKPVYHFLLGGITRIPALPGIIQIIPNASLPLAVAATSAGAFASALGRFWTAARWS